MERSRPEPTARRTRLPLPPPVAVGFLLAIVTVGIMALVMEGAMRSRAIVATRLVQSGEVVQRLERIDALVRTAESGQRGFLLVGRDSYLGDYDAALAQLPVELAALRTLLAGTPDKLDPLTALESGLREKQAELDQTLKQARAGDRDGALALVATDRGRMVMERVKTQLGVLRDDERALLTGIVDELFGEKIDIINYTTDQKEMVRRALIPGTVEDIEIDEENTIIRATVKDEEKAKVLGRGGTNINIAGDLLGYRISLTTIEGAPVDPKEEAPTE